MTGPARHHDSTTSTGTVWCMTNATDSEGETQSFARRFGSHAEFDLCWRRSPVRSAVFGCSDGAGFVFESPLCRGFSSSEGPK